MDLSIIIVNYNTKAVTLQCLESVYTSKTDEMEFEVILVDNHSTDGSVKAIAEKYPQVRLIVNDDNLGFSKANNIGIRAAGGRAVLLLNSDTVVEPDTLKGTFDYLMRHLDIGALGCKVVLADGTLDAACKRSFPTPANGIFHTLKLDRAFPNSRLFGSYNLTYLDEDEINDVDCLVGAYMMVPMRVIDDVGYLDEDFFMYGEDIDWCYRIKQADYRIVYYPKYRITHYKKVSGIGQKNPKVIEAFYDSMGIFYDKHYRGKYNGLTKKLVLSGTQLLKKRALKKNKR